MRKHILNTFAKKPLRKWDTLYWAIDIHDTCIKSNYSKSGVLPTEFFPKAKEVLQRLSKRNDCCLILFTCSHPHEIEKYMEFFNEHGIKFNHVNKNPEALNTAYGFFEHKFYFNFLLDDKAGFDPTKDWDSIEKAIDEIEYIESTPLNIRERHRKIARIFPYIAIACMIFIFSVGGLLSYLTNTTIIPILFISLGMGGLCLFLIKYMESSPLKFHFTNNN